MIPGMMMYLCYEGVSGQWLRRLRLHHQQPRKTTIVTGSLYVVSGGDERGGWRLIQFPHRHRRL